MDIISQLQEQVNTIALLAVNTFGSLQRDALPVRLSSDYPSPSPTATPNPNPNPNSPSKEMSAALVQAARTFEALVQALPLTGEEEQERRLAELQRENERVGAELRGEIEAAEMERGKLEALFDLATDNCLNLKKVE